MSEINVQLKDGEPVPVPDSATVAEALKKLDRDVAKQALAARVDGREVDLRANSMRFAANGECGSDRTDAAADARRSGSAASLDRAFAGRGGARSVSGNQAGNWTGAARRSALRIFLRRDCAAAA